jgi:hypothetical protein
MVGKDGDGDARAGCAAGSCRAFDAYCDVKYTVGPELPGEQGTDFHESKPWHLRSLNVGRPAEIVFVKAEGDPDNGPCIVDIDIFELFGYLYLVPGQ